MANASMSKILPELKSKLDSAMYHKGNVLPSSILEDTPHRPQSPPRRKQLIVNDDTEELRFVSTRDLTETLKLLVTKIDALGGAQPHTAPIPPPKPPKPVGLRNDKFANFQDKDLLKFWDEEHKLDKPYDLPFTPVSTGYRPPTAPMGFSPFRPGKFSTPMDVPQPYPPYYMESEAPLAPPTWPPQEPHTADLLGFAPPTGTQKSLQAAKLKNFSGESDSKMSWKDWKVNYERLARTCGWSPMEKNAADRLAIHLEE